jgi:hypothetical protein
VGLPVEIRKRLLSTLAAFPQAKIRVNLYGGLSENFAGLSNFIVK